MRQTKNSRDQLDASVICEFFVSFESHSENLRSKSVLIVVTLGFLRRAAPTLKQQETEEENDYK